MICPRCKNTASLFKLDSRPYNIYVYRVHDWVSHRCEPCNIIIYSDPMTYIIYHRFKLVKPPNIIHLEYEDFVNKVMIGEI